MATVLESITVSRSSTLPSVTFSPITASSIASLSARRSSAKLPQYRGLKLRPIAATRFSGSGIARHVGRIVCEASDTAVEVASITDADWQLLVLESDTPVLVEFWAPWCGPCRMIHPLVNELAKQYAGKLKCYKLNTDESPSTATRCGIRSIPTVMIFKNGEKKDTVIGAVPKSTLTTSIEKFL